jgi:hypothetical protein
MVDCASKRGNSTVQGYLVGQKRIRQGRASRSGCFRASSNILIGVHDMPGLCE